MTQRERVAERLATGGPAVSGLAAKDFANWDEVVIATKVHGKMHDGPNGAGLSRKATLSEMDKSRKRLGPEYVDLYQVHRWDYQTRIEETMEAPHDVVRACKARYIGIADRRIARAGS